MAPIIIIIPTRAITPFSLSRGGTIYLTENMQNVTPTENGLPKSQPKEGRKDIYTNRTPTSALSVPPTSQLACKQTESTSALLHVNVCRWSICSMKSLLVMHPACLPARLSCSSPPLASPTACMPAIAHRIGNDFKFRAQFANISGSRATPSSRVTNYYF